MINLKIYTLTFEVEDATRVRALDGKDAQESTHSSWDDTAAQNHRDKQKSRLTAYLKLRTLGNHRQPKD